MVEFGLAKAEERRGHLRRGVGLYMIQVHLPRPKRSKQPDERDP
jgi:hypothetical protein